MKTMGDISSQKAELKYHKMGDWGVLDLFRDLLPVAFVVPCILTGHCNTFRGS